MKKQIVYFLILLSCISKSIIAQDSTKTKIKEYYLTFASFSPFNIQLQFKKQVAKKTFFKLSLVNLSYNESHFSGSNSGQISTSSITYSGGLQLGLEFRKHLTKKFSLYHGPNLRATYDLSISRNYNPMIPQQQQKNTTQTLQGAIPYTLGLLFNITDHILIASEINPSIRYDYSWYTDGQNSDKNFGTNRINIGFDNRFATISLVYRP